MKEIDRMLFIKRVNWPRESGKEYLFLHVKLKGEDFMWFSRPGENRHAQIARSLETALQIPLGTIDKDKPEQNIGGGAVDIDLQGKHVKIYGESGEFGAYDRETVERLLTAEGFTAEYI